MRLLRPARLAAVALALIVGTATRGLAEEYHFAIVFGGESHPKQARKSHTWATFIRAVGTGPDLNTYRIEQHTISWMPASLKIHLYRLHGEPGVNLDLHQSLAWAYEHGCEVMMWGPLLIDRQVYERSLRIYWELRSGQTLYKAIARENSETNTNCIYSVHDVFEILGPDRYPVVRSGIPASRHIVREIVTKSDREQATQDSAWLIPRLGLDRYPIAVVPPQGIPRRHCLFCQQGP